MAPERPAKRAMTAGEARVGLAHERVVGASYPDTPIGTTGRRGMDFIKSAASEAGSAIGAGVTNGARRAVVAPRRKVVGRRRRW